MRVPRAVPVIARCGWLVLLVARGAPAAPAAPQRDPACAEVALHAPDLHALMGLHVRSEPHTERVAARLHGCEVPPEDLEIDEESGRREVVDGWHGR